MKHPQVVVFESDDRLAGQVRPLVAARRWTLRESKREEPCMNMLAEGGPSVFVIRIGESLLEELMLLGRVARQCPSVRTVAVVRAVNVDVVAGLAWDLDADFVLAPPMSSELLPDVVAALMGGP